MDSLIGLTKSSTSSYEQNICVDQHKYVNDSVATICRMLQNKEKEMSPSRRNPAYARLVIETILEADDGLSNEFWIAIMQQADLSTQPTSLSADSVLMRTVSLYVTRLLPIESTPRTTVRTPIVGEIGLRKHTPLDLFVPSSPLVNSMKIESQEFFSTSLHPRHLTIFCNFIAVLCSTNDFPSTNRLMMLRVAMFNLTVETVRVIRAIVEFAWKEPMVTMLRELGVNARPHTRELLEGVVSDFRATRESILLMNRKKQSFLQFLFGDSSSPSIRDKHEVVKCVEDLLIEADANMGTHFMAQTTCNHLEKSNIFNTPPLWETPKRAPSRSLPDHVRDPITGLMYLTDLGKRQVWSGERRFNFSICSEFIPHWKSMVKPYEFPPLVAVLTKVNEYLNKTSIVSSIAKQYSKDTVFGAIARTVMDPPCPNPRSTVSPPEMTLEEEVDMERKHYESDRVWFIRRTFLRKYWTEIPRDQLLCLSQLFVNINMIGCVYSDAVMEKVNIMGSGIMEEANSLYSEYQAEIARKKSSTVPDVSPSAAKAVEPPKIVQTFQKNSTRVSSEDSYTEEKMKQIRIFLLQADYRASAMEMLNHATGRARSPWTKHLSDGVMRISIANILIFQHKFIQPSVDWTECAVNAVVETFLHGGNIVDRMLHFNGSGPEDLYYNFLNRCLKKAEKLVSGAKTFKALLAALEKVNLDLSQHSTHLQGWSQKVDIRIGDLLASSRVLSKGECVRTKLEKAIDDMCAQISETISSGSPNIVRTEHGLELR
ncbi:hypothetical protein DICVIV_00220 [Dictyocaulus viviparus]|uniref:XRN2-binding (XTBD) domain-containing protein n=1 Tax=Dictyocaulus viviparus TaxID=29172 RepID=A0A0D8YBQ7_DICVI|nr:hypothetical protein DICVIV_00220 [Dictyocaulus viviparus]